MVGNTEGYEDIALEKVVTHVSVKSVTGARKASSLSAAPTATANSTDSADGLPGRRGFGRRKTGTLSDPDKDEGAEDGTLNRMGRIYLKILNFSVVTRYFIFVLPLAGLLAVPIAIGLTVAPKAKIGGVRMVWFFVWIEIVWLSLWISKIFAHFLPHVVQFLAGVVSPGVRKYSLVIRALEIPFSVVGWVLASLLTFTPLMIRNPDTQDAAKTNPDAANLQNWQIIIRQLLGASLVCSLVFLAERFLVQLISINYHRKQFDEKIKDNKRSVYLLGLLYDASRALFPAYCQEFAREDYVINDALNLSALGGNDQRKSGAPMRLLHNVGRFGDKVTSAFGTVAQEITGKRVFDLDSGHSIVVEALEKDRSCEALARRLWMSFVVEGREALFQDDIMDVLGPNHRTEAEECFASLDRDGNGDVSLDEMILTVTEIGRTRKSIASSMHDVDQAINVLDGLLTTVVFVISIFVFVAFLNKSFTTTLATAGTALLSLSFVFAATCQEVLGSCIFLFVKHPFDIGDRVDITQEALTVERISLLFTVFKRVTNGKMVQVPNIVLNNLWIENITRSKAMREQLSVFVNFDTSFDDIMALKGEMQKFVVDKDNNRDFQKDIDVDLIGIAEMNKMELRVEINHKNNWSNESVRAARRSKFMCALVAALRRVPIYGPGGGDAVLGSANSPRYTVSVSPDVAQKNKDDFAQKKETKRLFPSGVAPPPVSGPVSLTTGSDYGQQPTSGLEYRVGTSTGQWNSKDEISTLGERMSADRDRTSAEEERYLLKDEPGKGKRHPQQGLSPPVHDPSQQTYPVAYQAGYGQGSRSGQVSSSGHGYASSAQGRGGSTVRYAPPPGLTATAAGAAASSAVAAEITTSEFGLGSSSGALPQ